MKYQVQLAAALTAILMLNGCTPAQQPPQSASQPPEVSSSAPGDGSTSVPAPNGSGDVSDLPEEPDSAQGGEDIPAPAPRSQEDFDNLPTDAETLTAAVAQADWSWFDDAVIVGDSVSLKLKNYVVKVRQSDAGYFGQGQFLTSGSLGSGNALWEVSDKSVHPTYQGEKLRLEDSIARMGAKKVYIMVGVNDIAVYGIDGAIENYGKLLDLIQEKSPEVEFYLQSATPICEGAEKNALNNANLEDYNQKLKEKCQEWGVHFIDVARVLRDENGFLPRVYCSDPDGMGIHLTDPACQMWLGYLLEDAKLLQG